MTDACRCSPAGWPLGGEISVTLVPGGGLIANTESGTEPKEMCSTTHVHDDFRLVEVDRGVMVFWAAPGMQLTLHPGDYAAASGTVVIPTGATTANLPVVVYGDTVPETFALFRRSRKAAVRSVTFPSALKQTGRKLFG